MNKSGANGIRDVSSYQAFCSFHVQSTLQNCKTVGCTDKTHFLIVKYPLPTLSSLPARAYGCATVRLEKEEKREEKKNRKERSATFRRDSISAQPLAISTFVRERRRLVGISRLHHQKVFAAPPHTDTYMQRIRARMPPMSYKPAGQSCGRYQLAVLSALYTGRPSGVATRDLTQIEETAPPLRSQQLYTTASQSAQASLRLT